MLLLEQMVVVQVVEQVEQVQIFLHFFQEPPIQGLMLVEEVEPHIINQMVVVALVVEVMHHRDALLVLLAQPTLAVEVVELVVVLVEQVDQE